jgi:acyl-CoA thioester hydrolase
MTEPLRSAVDIEVRYKETDQMGHVHHANYIVWFELARTQLCRDVGVPYRDIEAAGYFLIVSGVGLRYVKPAHYGEIVTVTCWIKHLASRLIRF